jgi:hypothetical protein
MHRAVAAVRDGLFDQRALDECIAQALFKRR